MFPFSRERSVFWGVVSGRFPKKTREMRCFYNWLTNSRDRGVQVMGSELRYPLMLWEGEGAGRGPDIRNGKGFQNSGRLNEDNEMARSELKLRMRASLGVDNLSICHPY